MGEREPEGDPTYGTDLVGRTQAILAARQGTLEQRVVALEYALSETLTALTGCLGRLHRLESNVHALLALVARADEAVEAAPEAHPSGAVPSSPE